MYLLFIWNFIYLKGGTDIKVWDALAGGKLLAKITQHHKTVTCLKITSDGHKILSGSLDRHVKVYDTGTYKTLHTMEYPNSILSIGISVRKNDYKLYSPDISRYFIIIKIRIL
jgi:WD40 repeat protein